MFFVGEYLGMTLISALLGAVLRRLARPGTSADRLVSAQNVVFISFFILLRAALPRPRFDQLMAWGWKVMLPLALLNLVVTGAVVLAWS